MNAIEAAKYRRLSPIEPQSFSREADRDRLSAAGLAAYKSVCTIWKLSGSEAAAILGVSQSTWDRLKRPEATIQLNQDQLTRISAIVGVLKGLRLLFADDLSERWPKIPNRGPLFAGATPVQSMIEGGIPRMLEVRRYVDALRGGL